MNTKLLVILLLTELMKQLYVSGQCFDSVVFTVFRYEKKVILQRADTVNDEKEATEIYAKDQHINTLQAGCFKDLPKLKYVALTHSGIKHIEKSAFLNLPSIKSISIMFNNIEAIHNGIFHSLDITKLYLLGNKIETLEEHSFYNLTYLQILDLSHNNLYSLKSNIFYKTESLRKINISNNKLFHIQDYFFSVCFNSFDSPDSLIDLSSNYLSTIDRNIFKGVYYVESLLLNDNNITKIDPNAFISIIKSNILNLQGNNLEKIPNKILYGKFDEVLYDDEERDVSLSDSVPLGNFSLDDSNIDSLVLTKM